MPSRLVVLDSNKEEDREKILKDYEKMKLDHMPSFEPCNSAEKIKGILLEREYCPVYYLKDPAIENYLDLRPEDKRKGPETAYEMKMVPEEIRKIFEVLIEGSKIQIKKKKGLFKFRDRPR